jgi:hypothetical protein
MFTFQAQGDLPSCPPDAANRLPGERETTCRPCFLAAHAFFFRQTRREAQVKVAMISAVIALLATADAFAQANRVDTQIDQRLGGKLNPSDAPQIRGTSGPDPFVGPGSTSPFAKAPVIPMQSSPVRDASNPYLGGYPTAEPRLNEQPTEPQSQQRTLSPVPSFRESPSTRPIQGGSSQPDVGEKVGQRLSGRRPDESAEKIPTSGKDLRSNSLMKQNPCVNGRTRMVTGDCTGPLRPRPR